MSQDIYASLTPLTPRLEEASRKANTLLHRAKERLAASHVGVEAWVTIHAEGNERAGELVYSTLFGYAKREGAWNLFIAYLAEDLQGPQYDEGPFPVFERDRQTRIAAARALPLLVEKIKENAEKMISEIEAAEKLG